MIARRRLLTGAALLGLTPWAGAQGEPSALERVKKRGVLSVAVYRDQPPFSDKDGKGIDVDIAGALAEGLGLKPSLLLFEADESVDDDLRNAVWKGHYLGWGPADVMLHVPVDKPLIDANPQVSIFGGYYRERVMLAWDRERGAPPRSLAALVGQRVAVAGGSQAGWLLASAQNGILVPTLTTTYKDGVAAAKDLRAGKFIAAAGLASELESALAGQERYVVLPLPVPRLNSRDGLIIGCAVKRGATDLQQALQQRIDALTAGSELREIFKRYGVVWRM